MRYHTLDTSVGHTKLDLDGRPTPAITLAEFSIDQRSNHPHAM
jgi:hypothetical protein